MSDNSNNKTPSWKSEYPISQSEEHKTSRRTFAKFLGLSLFAVAGGYAIKDTLLNKEKSSFKKVIAKVGELKIGDSKIFHYPLHEPCMLIRLSEAEYVAYSQSCTHLMCPIHYNKVEKQIVCPCHHGYFDPKDGSVLAGPPPKALPSYKLTIKNGDITVG
tara:strand:+ start:1035 stop:1514 length:480 start_codon:yes stop_codon:yes gene_type:complete